MNFYIWRDRIVESLLGLSDITYQRLTWSGVITSSDGSPDEMLVTLMDDWAFASFVPDNHQILNDCQIKKIESLLNAISHYQKKEPDYNGDVDRVLENKAWCDVVAKARDLYIAFCPRDEIGPSQTPSATP